jgi:hypothetical protein
MKKPFLATILTALILMLPCCALAADRSFPTVREFQVQCINKKLLFVVLRATTAKELRDIAATIRLADRDVQRLYYTKLYDTQPSGDTAKQLLELMPQGELDSLQFYAYTSLYDDHPSASNWITQEEATQASDLYNTYYNLAWKLMSQYPQYLDRYLVMLRWLSDNAEMAEAIEDWEPALRKAFGKRYDDEKSRVWGLLDRPYDPPMSAGK